MRVTGGYSKVITPTDFHRKTVVKCHEHCPGVKIAWTNGFRRQIGTRTLPQCRKCGLYLWKPPKWRVPRLEITLSDAEKLAEHDSNVRFTCELLLLAWNEFLKQLNSAFFSDLCTFSLHSALSLFARARKRAKKCKNHWKKGNFAALEIHFNPVTIIQRQIWHYHRAQRIFLRPIVWFRVAGHVI